MSVLPISLRLFKPDPTSKLLRHETVWSFNRNWIFTSDYSKIRISVAINNGCNKFAVTVNSSIFSETPATDKRICDLKIHSKDGYYIKNDSYKLDMLEIDKRNFIDREIRTFYEQQACNFKSQNGRGVQL